VAKINFEYQSGQLELFKLIISDKPTQLIQLTLPT